MPQRLNQQQQLQQQGEAMPETNLNDDVFIDGYSVDCILVKKSGDACPFMLIILLPYHFSRANVEPWICKSKINFYE